MATLANPGDSALLAPAAAATASAKVPGHTRSYQALCQVPASQDESVQRRRTNRHSPRSNKSIVWNDLIPNITLSTGELADAMCSIQFYKEHRHAKPINTP